VLLEKLLVAVRDLEAKPDRFKVQKDLLKGYQNWDLTEPYYQVRKHMRLLANEHYWTTNDCLADLRSLEAEDLKLFFPELLKQMHFELLVHATSTKPTPSLLITTINPRPLHPG
jgi:insulysin